MYHFNTMPSGFSPLVKTLSPTSMGNFGAPAAAGVEVRCRRVLTPDAAREALGASPSVRLHEQGPTPRRAGDPDAVHVGRVRFVDPGRPDSGLMLWVVADNLRQGAASNAVAVAESLLGPEA